MKSHVSWSPSQCLYSSQKQEHTNRRRLWRRGALYESQRKITVSTCYNTNTNIQRTYAHAVIKGVALEWVWCPEQALKAFLRFGALLKGISAALQKCPSQLSPLQTELLPVPKQELLNSELGNILGGAKSTHLPPLLLLCSSARPCTLSRRCSTCTLTCWPALMHQ